MRNISTLIIVISNCVLGGLVLISGILYPVLIDWSCTAIFMIFLFVIIEFSASKFRILDAAHISLGMVNAISTLVTIGFLLPYKIGWGNWWALLAAITLGGTIIVNIIIASLFRLDGVADLKPKSEMLVKVNPRTKG